MITNNILYENAVDEKLPDALRIDTSNAIYFFSVYDYPHEGTGRPIS